MKSRKITAIKYELLHLQFELGMETNLFESSVQELDLFAFINNNKMSA